jgi:hypothetical protein
MAATKKSRIVEIVLFKLSRLFAETWHRFSKNPNPRPTGETVGTQLNSLRLIVNCVDLPPRQMSLDVPH